MNKPHKHAALIKAWADGAVIQLLADDGEWNDVGTPAWSRYYDYRIKPGPEPDVVLYGHQSWIKTQGRAMRFSDDEVKFTFDGKTGKLKSVSLI